MATGTGLDAQLGIAAETTYGTYVAPTTFYPFTSEDLSLEKTYIRSQGLRAGRLSQSEDLHVATTRQGAGSVNLELLNKGMGKLFNLLHGNTVTPTQQGVTTAYLQTHNIGTSAPTDKSVTLQVGKPSTGGTVHPFSYLGCKVTSVTFSLEAGGLVSCTWNFDIQDESTAQSLGTASYTADAVPFDFTQGDVLVDSTSIGNVRSVTIECTIPQETSRHHLGNSGIKDKPLVNGLVEVTATADLEFEDLDDHNRFKNETVVQLDLNLTGAVISGAESYECNFTLNAAKQTSSAPVVGGPDILVPSVGFEGLDDGTNPPLVIAYKSTDTSL